MTDQEEAEEKGVKSQLSMTLRFALRINNFL